MFKFSMDTKLSYCCVHKIHSIPLQDQQLRLMCNLPPKQVSIKVEELLFLASSFPTSCYLKTCCEWIIFKEKCFSSSLYTKSKKWTQAKFVHPKNWPQPPPPPPPLISPSTTTIMTIYIVISSNFTFTYWNEHL